MTSKTTIHGCQLIDISRNEIESCVSKLLSIHRDRFAGASILVIPDLHYPYHPSSGLVTNPTVVEAIVSEIQSFEGAEIAIGCRSNQVIDTKKTVDILGYNELSERLGVDCIDLSDSEMVTLETRRRENPIKVTIPKVLSTTPIVNVPTIRYLRETGLTICSGNLGQAATNFQPTTEDIVAVTEICHETVSVIDGTYTYAEKPHRSGILLSCTDGLTVDRTVASMINQNPHYLEKLPATGSEETELVEGVSLVDLVEEFRACSNRRSYSSERLMHGGFRFYAKISGDAIPPQLLG